MQSVSQFQEHVNLEGSKKALWKALLSGFETKKFATSAPILGA